MNERAIWPAPGHYLLAISGGVDSMVLLDLMAAARSRRGYELVVAHFNHGIRPDAHLDSELVEHTARRHGLPFVGGVARLGAAASEAAARSARQAFLDRARVASAAQAVVTAHHQDDLLETSLLNLARGSGRQGLAPMGPSTRVLRPLLRVSRAHILEYARAHRLTWHEDSTNTNLANPRNFLRHRLLAQANSQWREQYLGLMTRLAALNSHIDAQIQTMVATYRLDAARYSFPREVVRDWSLIELAEIIVAVAHSLRPGVELDHRIVQEIALFAKISPPHRQRMLRQGINMLVQPDTVRIYYMGISKVGKL